MNTPKKIAQYVRTSLSSVGSLFSPDSPDITVVPVDNQSDSCIGEGTVVIRREEFEDMRNELSGQAEAIKRLRTHEEEYISKIQEYEAMFTEVLRKELFNKKGVSEASKEEVDLHALRSSYEKEIMRLKSMEDRLKSHVNALKRDLIAAEQAAEETEDRLRCEIFEQREAIGDVMRRLEATEMRNGRLIEENEYLKELLKGNAKEELDEIL
ncbi:hypothetical protein PAEPH01_1937 [Pancytospora epiphaga]|nr:hypothetical protein PAEPH01_1937 [Pancytospora epiphaga]